MSCITKLKLYKKNYEKCVGRAGCPKKYQINTIVSLQTTFTGLQGSVRSVPEEVRKGTQNVDTFTNTNRE